MSAFDSAVAHVLVHEAGYSNDPRDPGGETNWGISKRQYPTVDIKNLTRVQAIEIYRRDYWDKCRCGDLPPALGFVVMDCAVNQGCDEKSDFYAQRNLQRAIGAKDDGRIGPRTIATALTAGIGAVARFQTARLRRYAALKTWATYG